MPMRNSFITILLLGALVLLPSAAHAATVELSPNSLSREVGETMALNITVDPALGETAYTAKVQLTYPTDVLDFESFTLSSDWQALTQAGYDVEDEADGVIIKTAGLPGGFSDARSFGTITFTGTGAGNGAIEAVDASIIFDENNDDIAEALPTTVAVSVSEVTTQVQTTPEDTTSVPQTQVVETPAEEGESEEAPGTEVAEEAGATSSDNQVAAAGEAPLNMQLLLTLLVILFAALSGVFGYLWYRNRKSV